MSANHPTFDDGVVTGRRQMLDEIVTFVGARAEGLTAHAERISTSQLTEAEIKADPAAAMRRIGEDATHLGQLDAWRDVIAWLTNKAVKEGV